LLAGLRFAGQSTARTFFNVYLDDGLGASTALIGALAAAGQLLAVPAALATPLLLARWSKGRAIFLGSLGQALSQCLLALVPHWSAAGLGLAGTTALFSMTTTVYRLFSQELVPVRWRSATSSALMMGGGLSLTLMSAFGGLAISALGYTSLFLIGAALTTAGALIFWVYFRTERSLANEQSPETATTAGE
jgi:predicted MFS family arabinose efflux permease